MDNNLQTISTEMDQIVDAFSADDATALMQASGQNIGGDRREGLSRLNINYDTETEDGHTLTRGDWKMFYEGEYIYAKEVFLQPILRTFEWSLFNAEEGNFSCKSIQKPTMTGDFPDTDGGTKCGRLSVDEEEKLKDDDPVRLRSRSAVCNQVIYGMISGSFVKGNKEKIEVKNHPVISYFKRSGFVPISSFIQTLTRQKKIMQKCVIKIGTQRQKKGSVTYWIPVPSLSSETEINDTDKELMKKFAETVKAHNENIMNQYRDAVKLISPAKDDDLAGDFSAANA
tara:strand:- start:283 stop:1137 length:855 start_codon:yes stop_codon:yes gene_type:complete